MIALLYGRAFAPLLVVPIEQILAAGADRNTEIAAISFEHALERPALRARVERLYVLPFDLPASETEPVSSVLRRLFPRAEVLNPPDVHDLCWDKVRTNTRLLDRGIPVPESLYTTSAEEARAFVAAHQFVLLKEIEGCGGAGHIVLCDTEDVLVGEARERRFVVELDEASTQRRLAEGVLSVPPPYYLQKLVGTADAKERFIPPQVLRAYIVEKQITFWTERYRDQYRRPSDWIINFGLGARYRFVAETSAELRTLALRAADVLGIRIGAVDIVRTSGGGPFVIEADTDGCHMYIDRSFVQLPEFRAPQDFDAQIAAALIAPVPEVHPRHGVPQDGGGDRAQAVRARGWDKGTGNRDSGEDRDRWRDSRSPRSGDERRDERRPARRELPARRPFDGAPPRGVRSDAGPQRDRWQSSSASPSAARPRTRGGPPSGPWARDNREPRSGAAPPSSPRQFPSKPFSRDRDQRGSVSSGRSFGDERGVRRPRIESTGYVRPRRRKTEVTFTKGVRDRPVAKEVPAPEKEARERSERRDAAPTRTGPPPRGAGAPPATAPRRGPWKRTDGASRGGPPPRPRTDSKSAADARRSPPPKRKQWRQRASDDPRGSPPLRTGPRTRGGPRSSAPGKMRKAPAPRRAGPRKPPPK